jgi:flagellar motor protein MotB
MKTTMLTCAVVVGLLGMCDRVQADTQAAPNDTPTRILNEMKAPPVLVQDELIRQLQPEVQRGDIAIYDAQDMIKVTMASHALFDSGSARIHPEGADVLKRIGNVLKNATNWKATLTGHADNQKIRPSLQKQFANNMKLSKARAENSAALLKEAGVDAAAISTSGKGDSQPIASNATAEGRSKNRRVELMVFSTEAKPGAKTISMMK